MNFLGAAKAERSAYNKNQEVLRSQTVTRYVFCAYLDAIVPSLGAFGGRIPKGRIVPIYRPWRIVNLRKEGLDKQPDLDRNRFQRIKDKTTGKAHDYMAREYFSPADVIDFLAREYVKVGTGEITSLTGLDIEDFEKLKLNQLLFGVNDTSEDETIFPTAKSYYDQLGKVGDALKKQGDKFKDQAKVMEKVMKEVTQYVSDANAFARNRAEHANNIIGKEINNYDVGQLYAFQFANVTKRDEALNNMAILQTEAVKSAFQPSTFSADFMEGMKEMMLTVASETAKATAVEVAKVFNSTTETIAKK